MNPSFISFEYDYDSEKWNLPRGTVPTQLKTQGVPHALWMHFWDYSQSVVERSSVRSIMKKKLKAECSKGNLSVKRRQEREAEIGKLDDQTNRDFEYLQRQAERLFPNTKARVSQDARGKQFGLEIQLLHPTLASDTVQLRYDDRHASWNLPRDVIPTSLAEHGVPVADWSAIWDYGFGVNQRAKEREHLNQLHDRELRLCQKSLSYMNSTHIASVDTNAASSHNTAANHIRMKIEKLRRAREANLQNTKKGWQELQRRAAQRFEPYGVKVYLSHPETEICCGLQFHCPKKTVKDSSSVNSAGNKRRSTFYHSTPSAIWLPSGKSSPVPSQPAKGRSSPIPSVWMTIPKQHLSPKKPDISSDDDPASATALRTKTPEKENAPPKPERARKHTKKETSRSVWGQPVVLTYVHDDIPSRIDIEVSAPLTPTSSAESFDDEDSHGYVVPPAPSRAISSLESCSSGASVTVKVPPKKFKRVCFGENSWHTYDAPSFSRADKKKLWFSHEERESNRGKTKLLAQRVIDNRNSGGANNVVFMDSETEQEVCWRGLEHAKRGNLSFRQETRRAFLVKVLEKQRLLQLDSWTSRRGTVEDPAAELQQYAMRQSRQCRERAQKLAAQDAKDARAVYKESLRRANLQHNHNSANVSGASSLGCSTQHSKIRQSPHYHQQHDLPPQNDIFQDYCRQMHLATKARLHQQTMVM